MVFYDIHTIKDGKRLKYVQNFPCLQRMQKKSTL